MFKRLFLLGILLFVFKVGFAQNPLGPCGTAPEKSAWLQKYQAAPAAYQKNLDTIIYVPLTIHLLGTDEGLGFFNYRNLMEAFCTLNEDYESANIQFYMEGEVHYIQNTAWFEHETLLEGGQMMFANNVEHTLNCYFVADPAGNCGYALPYAGLAVAKSCANPNDHTWSHEVGHALSLPHPFLGWEGGVSYDDSVPPNFNAPAPLTVTYDYTFFQDTLILDTLIIDTAYVEFVDGSNCGIAADGFCDTSPDYLANRWFCDGNMESATQQKDPSGATFKSDGTLIMSYSDDACAYRFSAEQMAAMRANLYDEKSDYLYNQTTENPVATTAVLLSPSNDQPVQYNYVPLEWEEVANATHYLVEVSLLSSFPLTVTKTYVSTENSIVLEDLQDQKKYYWRIRGFNRQHFCAAYSGYESFETENLLKVNSIDGLSALNLYPNVLNPGVALHVEALASQNAEGKMLLFNNLGQIMTEMPFTFYAGMNNMLFEIRENLPEGLYFFTLNVDGQFFTQKVILAN